MKFTIEITSATIWRFLKRCMKIFAVVLLLFFLWGAYYLTPMHRYGNATVKKTFQSPDKAYELVLYRYASVPYIPSFPGQSSGANGFMRLYGPSGDLLQEERVYHMLEFRPKWKTNELEVWFVGSDGGLDIVRWELDDLPKESSPPSPVAETESYTLSDIGLRLHLSTNQSAYELEKSEGASSTVFVYDFPYDSSPSISRLIVQSPDSVQSFWESCLGSPEEDYCTLFCQERVSDLEAEQASLRSARNHIFVDSCDVERSYAYKKIGNVSFLVHELFAPFDPSFEYITYHQGQRLAFHVMVEKRDDPSQAVTADEFVKKLAIEFL